MAYAEIFEAFPPELRLPIARLVDVLRDELSVSRADFAELKAVVRELAQAQQQTELRIEELVHAQQRSEAGMEVLKGVVRELTDSQQRTETHIEQLGGAVQKLAEAQQHTEVRMERLEDAVQKLAEAQQRTEVRMERLEDVVQKLADAQQRTEIRMEDLGRAVQELAEAQKRTDMSVDKLTDEHRLFRYSFHSQIGGLGARWGMQTEEAFRQGMRVILQEVGFTTERFLDYDAAGQVFGHPDQVELDVVIRDGKVMVIEIKSALDQGNTYLFDRKVAFYTRKTGRPVDRKLIITPYADNRARELSMRLGVEVCTDITTLT